MRRTIRATTVVPRVVLGVATALAAVVAVVYFAIGFGMVPEGFKSPPAPVMVLAGFAYLVGGGVILLADRRLMFVGAVVNGLVLTLFTVQVLLGIATVDLLSLSGKVPQVALGVLLVWFVKKMGTGQMGTGQMGTGQKASRP